MAKVAVVIPVYKEQFSETERISLEQEQKVLGKYPLIFIAPEGAKLPELPEGSKVFRFPEVFFKNVWGYSTLMLQVGFYQAFLEYDYILLYQLDAFVFYDRLEHFCGLGYDYIGAPWPYQWGRKVIGGTTIILRVGNGGFCLRSPKACHRLLLEHPERLEGWKEPEDAFFAYWGVQEGSGFRTAPLSVAREFSMEFHPERAVRKNGGKLPFGCHAWCRYSRDFYIRLIGGHGYDISFNRENMKDDDLIAMALFLQSVAWSRLQRRIRRGGSVGQYLPEGNYDSVRVLRTPNAMLMLLRLTTEGGFPARDIRLYEPGEEQLLAKELKESGGRHLLLTDGNDVSWVRTAVGEGVEYGTHLVSFWREYMVRMQAFLKRLGR